MSSILISDLATKLSSQMRVDDKYQSGILGRTTQTLTTSNDRYSNNGVSQITSKIPASSYIDSGCVYWRGYLAFTPGCRLSKSIHSLFRRVQVKLGSQIIHDTDGMNVLQTVLNDTTLNQDEANGSFSVTTLTGSDRYREQIATGIQFSYTPNLSILRQNKIIPMHLIGQPLEFTFFLEADAVALIKVDQSLQNFGFEISNMEIVYDVLTVTPQVESAFQSAWENNRLAYPLQNWRMSPFQSNAGVADLKVEAVGQSNRTLVMVSRLVSRLLDPNVDSFQRTAQSLRYVQVNIGSNLLARYSCLGGASQLMQELQKAVDFSNNGTINSYNYHCQLPGLTAAEDAQKSSKFVFMQNLELSRFDNTITSGTANVPITVSVEYANQILPTSYYMFVLTDSILTIGRDGINLLG